MEETQNSSVREELPQWGQVTPGVAQTQPFYTQNQHQHGQHHGRSHKHLPALSPPTHALPAPGVCCGSQQLLQPCQMCSTPWDRHFGLQEASLEAAEEEGTPLRG